jgi:hypothetical protein
MATPQRKRKPGLRQPNGRLRLPSKADREGFAKRMEEIEMRTVLDQPHRLGSRDQNCEDALGRFFRRNRKLRSELKDASEHYRETKRRWRAAWGAPIIDRIEGGGGLGPLDATVRKWERNIMEMEHAMIHSSRYGIGPFRWLCLENIDTTKDYDEVIISCMMALATHLGRIDGKAHPFQKDA